jgi:glycosyltransferase involved in cell wall biosynthesis
MRIADGADAFATAVLKLLDDANEREALARRAHRFVEATYGWEAIVPRLEKLYEAGSGRD